MLVANPPYGERIEGGHTDWAAMARVLRDRRGGWRVVPLFPPSAKRSLSALELDEEAAFKTGGIAARVRHGPPAGCARRGTGCGLSRPESKSQRNKGSRVKGQGFVLTRRSPRLLLRVPGLP